MMDWHVTSKEPLVMKENILLRKGGVEDLVVSPKDPIIIETFVYPKDTEGVN